MGVDDIFRIRNYKVIAVETKKLNRIIFPKTENIFSETIDKMIFAW